MNEERDPAGTVRLVDSSRYAQPFFGSHHSSFSHSLLTVPSLTPSFVCPSFTHSSLSTLVIHSVPSPSVPSERREEDVRTTNRVT